MKIKLEIQCLFFLSKNLFTDILVLAQHFFFKSFHFSPTAPLYYSDFLDEQNVMAYLHGTEDIATSISHNTCCVF